MPSKNKKVNIVTSAASLKIVDAAIANLNTVASNTAKAIIVIDKNNKKLTNEAKRLSKKRAVLTKKKKNAAVRVKKSPIAANKKALKAVEKEMATVIKDVNKITAEKTLVLEELNNLKSIAKRATTYAKVVISADKILNKPKPKKKKSAKKPVLKAVETTVSNVTDIIAA